MRCIMMCLGSILRFNCCLLGVIRGLNGFLGGRSFFFFFLNFKIQWLIQCQKSKIKNVDEGSQKNMLKIRDFVTLNQWFFLLKYIYYLLQTTKQSDLKYYIILLTINQMLDLVQEIQNYPPHHHPNPNHNKPNFGQEAPHVVKTPLIDQYNQSSLADSKVQSKQQETGCMRFFKLKFYESFFKVSQSQVFERIKSAVIPPYKQDFIELTIKNNPDFYGPFWILTTIFFLLGFIGNLSSYLNFKIDGVMPYFELQDIRYAFIVIYSFGIGTPFILFFTLKIMGNELKLPDLICTYGYSLSCFIPAIILCIVPLSIFHWIFLFYAFANSTLFMITSINKHIEGIRTKSIVVFCIIGGIQFTLFLCCKLLFIYLKTPKP